eukprot:2720333-Prymnesium_polylepis.1
MSGERVACAEHGATHSSSFSGSARVQFLACVEGECPFSVHAGHVRQHTQNTHRRRTSNPIAGHRLSHCLSPRTPHGVPRSPHPKNYPSSPPQRTGPPELSSLFHTRLYEDLRSPTSCEGRTTIIKDLRILVHVRARRRRALVCSLSRGFSSRLLTSPDAFVGRMKLAPTTRVSTL